MAISPAPLCPGDRTVSCIPGDPSQPRFVCPQPVLSPSAALWWAHTYLNDGAALTQAGGESLWQESPSAAAPGSRHLRAVNTIPASHEGSGRRGGGTGDVRHMGGHGLEGRMGGNRRDWGGRGGFIKK